MDKSVYKRLYKMYLLSMVCDPLKNNCKRTYTYINSYNNEYIIILYLHKTFKFSIIIASLTTK